MRAGRSGEEPWRADGVPAGRLAPVRAAWAATDTVLKRQVVFAALYGVAVLLIALPGLEMTVPGLVLAGVGLEAAVLGAAMLLPWDAWQRWTQEVLPLASVGSIVLLEYGMSMSEVSFSALVVVPCVTLAWSGGWRGVVLGTGVAVVVVLAPVVLQFRSVTTQASVVRGVLVPLVCLAVAAFVAAASDTLRNRAVVAEDLTAQVQASRDVLAGLVDAATEQSIVATDPDGTIEIYNQGAVRLTGWSSDEAGGRSILEMRLADELDAAAEEAGIRRLPGESVASFHLRALVGPAATGGVHAHDWTLLHRGVPKGTVRLTVTRRPPLPDTGNPGYLFIATDITEQRETERAKDEFIGYVSHELRTPISSVLGYLELLGLDDDNLTDEQQGYLEVIDRNAHRQLRLVNDLLLAAQLESGRFAVVPEPTDLRTIVATSVASFGPQAVLAGVELEDASTGEVPVQGDVVRLGQLVDNLVSNALKFTPTGGTVVVRAARGVKDETRNVAILTVRDTGIGIPASEVRQLTDKFFRASTATNRRIPGVGLGLTISQAIIDAHGGDLVVSSVEGEGTTFSVTLPA